MAETKCSSDPLEPCPGDCSRRDFLRDGVTRSIAALAVFGFAHDGSAVAVRLLTGARRAGTVTYPIPATDGVTIDRANQVILVRWEDTIYAFALSCPHQNTALRWLGDAGRFQCPKHKSKYSPDGTFQSGRATRGMDRYAVVRDGESVVVDVAVLYKETDDAAVWRAACVKLA